MLNIVEALFRKFEQWKYDQDLKKAAQEELGNFPIMGRNVRLWHALRVNGWEQKFPSRSATANAKVLK